MRIPRSLTGCLAALSVVLLGGCLPELDGSQAVASYPVYTTAREIVGAADLVVRGVALRSRVEELRPDVSTGGDPAANPQAGLTKEQAEEVEKAAGVVVTITTVRVDEVIKGEATVGDLVEVSQLGGELNGTRHREEHTTLLSTDTTGGYVLLLAAHGPGRPYDLLNPEQAMYTVSTDGRLQTPSGNDDLGIDNLDELKSAAAAD